MKIELTTENINKLIISRETYDFYKQKLLDEPDNISYSQNREYALALLGFESSSQFKFINAAYNISEFDNCYRVRNKNKPLTVEAPEMEINDFCIAGSGCKKRGYPPCANNLNIDFVTCYLNDNIISKFMDYKDSLICQEHYKAAEKLGLDTSKLYAPHPIGLITHYEINPEFLTPIYCEGVCIKIKEPLFDLFWGMERYANVAKIQWDLRKGIYENANSNLLSN